MGVLGIVTCEILELEFAQLLGTDPEAGRISVLEDRRSARLIELLEARQVRNLYRLPHLNAFRREPGERLEVLLRVLEIGLHRNAKVLRAAVARAAHELSPHVDALLLGYGRCGNALEPPRTLLDVDKPVFLPMDHGCPVDDCVALCLGGRDCYYAEQCKIAGTFFLTPGWSRHWKQMLDPRCARVTLPGLKRLLSSYERVLLVQTPALANDELLRRGEEFSKQTGLRLEVSQGTMDLLTAAWEEAKHFLQPNVVPPGNGAAL
jgi:hypothetical protein